MFPAGLVLMGVQAVYSTVFCRDSPMSRRGSKLNVTGECPTAERFRINPADVSPRLTGALTYCKRVTVVD
jgi:hypothetical protein